MYEQELPHNLDDFPNHILKSTVEQDKIITDEDQRKKAAYQYMQQLEKNLRTKISSPQQKQQTMAISLELYDTIFNKIYCNTLFKDQIYPLGENLEEIFNDEFDSLTKLLYNESVYRHSFQSIYQQFNLQTSKDSWQNYHLLFSSLQQKQHLDIPLPATWIWDILDEFIYQFYIASKWRRSLTDLTQIKNVNEFWNLEESLQLLEQSYSQRNNNTQITTFQLLANYSYLAAIRLYIMSGNYQKAQELLSKIDYNDLIIFSKSGGAYQSLFYNIGFIQFITGDYKKSVLTLTLIVNYFNKFKQLYTKSYQFEQLIKQHEKIITLLAIAILFYPDTDDHIFSIMKETRNKIYEKYEKLLKYDSQILGELFLQVCPKIIPPILNNNDFQNISIINDNLLNNLKERILQQSIEIKQINDVEQILALYNKISIQHFNKLIPEKYIKLYIERNNVKLNEQNIFETNVLSKFWQNSKLLELQIQNDSITIKETQVNQREFINQLSQLNSNFEKNLQELIRNL